MQKNKLKNIYNIIYEQAITFIKDTSKLYIDNGYYKIELKRNLDLNYYNLLITLYDDNNSNSEYKLANLIRNKFKGQIIDKKKNNNIFISQYIPVDNKSPESMITNISKQINKLFDFDDDL